MDKVEAAKEVVVGVKAVVAEAKEGGLPQDRVVIASARTVAKEQSMNWVPHVMSKNAPNAATPWHENKAAYGCIVQDRRKYPMQRMRKH